MKFKTVIFKRQAMSEVGFVFLSQKLTSVNAMRHAIKDGFDKSTMRLHNLFPTPETTNNNIHKLIKGLEIYKGQTCIKWGRKFFNALQTT